MKNLFLICCCFAIVSVCAQDAKQTTMEKRARELHRVMGVNDKEQWKKFMKENYTKSMLERPVKSSIETPKRVDNSASSTSTADKLEEKLKVFERLHDNFANSKIVSLKTVDEKIEMIIENTSDAKGKFQYHLRKQDTVSHQRNSGGNG